METLGIGVAGCGVVGSGVVELLVNNRDLYRRRLNVDLDLRAVAEPEASRVPDLPDVAVFSDAFALLEQNDIQVVIETIGGIDIARKFILQAFTKGKHVVTANKALLAHHGPALYRAAREHQVTLSFEASCGGSIPIVAAIRESFASDRITSIKAILNGTCNYILTRMSAQGRPYAAALKEAQKKGYAEADPTLDVNGTDTAHKLAILASLAFDVEVAFENIYVEGISEIDPKDIHYADTLGYGMKLLAVGNQHEDGTLTLSVHPALISKDNPLASVAGVFNAVTIESVAAGTSMLYGRGAGKLPTASAVVADIMDVALGRAEKSFHHVSILAGRAKPAVVRNIADLESRYYMRCPLLDQPGVLAKITGMLGKRKIGIASVIQQEADATEAVPVILMTHAAKESDLRQAMEELAQLDMVRNKITCFRVIS